MSTEISNPDPDNEIPPVPRFLGRAVSEWVTYTFIVLCIIAVIFGSIVGGERDAQVDRAMAALEVLEETAEIQASSGAELICDNSLLTPELLANDYLTLSVGQAPINEDDKSLGYGPALYVSVVEKEVSGDTWDTAKRLMDRVKEMGEEEAEKEDPSAEQRIATTVAVDNDEETDSEEIEKPKNRLREVRKKVYGDDEEYLRYFILASENALCREDV